jgi:hypothetical protein
MPGERQADVCRTAGGRGLDIDNGFRLSIAGPRQAHSDDRDHHYCPATALISRSRLLGAQIAVGRVGDIGRRQLVRKLTKKAGPPRGLPSTLKLAADERSQSPHHAADPEPGGRRSSGWAAVPVPHRSSEQKTGQPERA